MTKFFATLLIVCFSTTAIVAQNNFKFPTLAQLETYIRTVKTNLDFKPIAKQWGFTFEIKDEDENTDYIYVRHVKTAKKFYTERFIFTEGANDFRFISLSSTRDVEGFYLPSIKKKYKSEECNSDGDNDVLFTCFQNKLYFIRLIDHSTEFEDGTKGNSYTIRIVKL